MQINYLSLSIKSKQTKVAFSRPDDVVAILESVSLLGSLVAGKSGHVGELTPLTVGVNVTILTTGDAVDSTGLLPVQLGSNLDKGGRKNEILEGVLTNYDRNLRMGELSC